MKKSLSLLLLLAFSSCSQLGESEKQRIRKNNEVAEKIYRLDDEFLFAEAGHEKAKRVKYPWEDHLQGDIPKITKEYFRCRGSSMNPERDIHTKKIRDCDGMDKHGLPYDGKSEFVYPILIQLLNYLQEKTQEKVIITSGHRCPVHNEYVNPEKRNRTSKHQVGAEVDFYVQNLEEQPFEIVKLLMQFYQEKGEQEYLPFHRSKNNNTGLRHSGWYNKEIVVRVHEKDESRDLDNRHPYSFISIEVRYDRDGNRYVLYDWNKAYKGYLRF